MLRGVPVLPQFNCYNGRADGLTSLFVGVTKINVVRRYIDSLVLKAVLKNTSKTIAVNRGGNTSKTEVRI